jgi:hypothetical protein
MWTHVDALRVHPNFAISTNPEDRTPLKSMSSMSCLKAGLKRLGCTYVLKRLAEDLRHKKSPSNSDKFDGLALLDA